MPKRCTRCHKNKASASAIVNGVYYHDICTVCKAALAPLQVSSGHARWQRDIDLIDHEADVQQPFSADGSINPRFAKLYPTQAKALFTPEQLRRASL